MKVQIGEFKGHKTLSIVDSLDRNIISFGLTKAKAILACVKDIESFVSANSKQESIKVDLDELSDEQRLAIMKFIGR